MFHEYIDTLYIVKPPPSTSLLLGQTVQLYINPQSTKKKRGKRENGLLAPNYMRHDCNVSAVLKQKNGHIIRKGLYIRGVTGTLDSIIHFPFQLYHEIRPPFNESRPSNVFLISFIRAFLHICRRHARVSCANLCMVNKLAARSQIPSVIRRHFRENIAKTLYVCYRW